MAHKTPTSENSQSHLLNMSRLTTGKLTFITFPMHRMPDEGTGNENQKSATNQGSHLRTNKRQKPPTQRLLPAHANRVKIFALQALC